MTLVKVSLIFFLPKNINIFFVTFFYENDETHQFNYT